MDYSYQQGSAERMREGLRVGLTLVGVALTALKTGIQPGRETLASTQSTRQPRRMDRLAITATKAIPPFAQEQPPSWSNLFGDIRRRPHQGDIGDKTAFDAGILSGAFKLLIFGNRIDINHSISALFCGPILQGHER